VADLPPRISVVIPAFNSAWSIGDTLKSVVAQRYADLEIIVVNDGSGDDLHAAVATASDGDRRVRIIDQVNGGLANARNRGICAARAPLVGLIDADDLWHPDFLTALYDALASRPFAPFAFAYSMRIDTANRLIPSAPWPHEPRHDLEGLVTVNSVGNGSAALFRRSALEAVGGFDESFATRNLQGAEDWKLCVQLAGLAAPVLVPRRLVAYRLVPNSMSQADPARQLAGIRAVLAEIAIEHPNIGDATMAHARTMMIGWLLPAFFRQRNWGAMVRLLKEAYLDNLFWFQSRDLRALHRMKIESVVRGAIAAMLPKLHAPYLADMREGGGRPFAFLDGGMGSPDRLACDGGETWR
jgi:glycosyltransferase involved in cell wall biosynthesis